MKAITAEPAVNGADKVVYQVNADKVEVVSSVITADEFLDLLTLQSEEYPLAPGKHAVIHSLTYAEVKRIIAQNKGDQDELELSALVIGTEFPHITPAMMAQLREKKAGPLMNMAKRIMVISGMMDDAPNLGEDGASS